MQCGQDGLALIRKWESCSLSAYQDVKGIWSIGWGCAAPWVTEGMTCTQDQADAWLQQHIDMLASTITRMITTPLNQNQFDALCSLVYNIGSGNFASSSALALINENLLTQVPVSIARWCKITVDGKLVFSQGLYNRRMDEVKLWNSPLTNDQ